MHLAETIGALARSTMPPRQQSGAGTMVISDKGAWLQTPSERIPVELPPANSLRDGMPVRFSIADGVITITPMETGPSTVGKAIPDAFTPTRNDAAPATATVRPGIRLDGTLPAGLHLFTDAEEAAAFIGAKTDPALLRQLRELVTADGAVAVKIETANDLSRATLVPLSGIDAALKALRASFTSAQLGSVPVDVLAQVLFDRGSLPFTPFAELDRMLAGNPVPFPAQRAGSVDAQNSALVQWLHAALSNDKLPERVAPLAPLATASTFMTELEAQFPAAAGSAAAAAPGGSFGLTQQSLLRNADDIDPVAMAARNMGYTLEKTLIDYEDNRDSSDPDRTLKALLLKNALPMPAENMMPQLPASPGTDRAKVIAGAPVSGTFPEKMTPDTTTPTAALLDQLTVIKRDLATMLSQTDSGRPAGAGTPQTATIPVQQLPPGEPPAPAPLFFRRATELASESVSIVNKLMSCATTASQVPAGMPAERLIMATPGIPEITATLIRSAESLILAVSHSGNTLPSTQFAPLLQAVLDALDSVMRLLQPAPHAGPAASDGAAPQHQAPPSHGAPSPQQEPQPASATHAPTLFSKAAEAILDRFESLQLLARPAPAAQGTQQIIALPIKFGESWTEVNVRFLHHRKRKTDKNRPQYSAYINVAPAALGAISAHLDYSAPAGIRLGIGFERTATRSWFIEHRTELTEALSRSGKVSVQVELHQLRKKPGTSGIAAAVTASTIDMTG